MKATPERATEVVEMVESQSVSQDRLFRRLQDQLHDMIADREALERLARYEITMRTARTAAIVEARALLPRIDEPPAVPGLVPMH